MLIIMAFFGPNAEILGNIKLSIWQFETPIQDIQAYVYNIAVWLIVDLASLAVNGIVIWYFCNINILKVMKKMQEGHWALFALAEAYLMMEVSYKNKSIDIFLVLNSFFSCSSSLHF